MLKLKAKSIINTRNNIVTDKAAYWKIIQNENIMSKKAKRAGAGSGYDLAELYNKITQFSETMVNIKLYLQAINSGYTTFTDAPNMEHWKNIFMLCEKKELWKGLGKIKTINPDLKSKKGKMLTQIETFTSQKISSMRAKLQLEINNLEAKITTFNDNAELEIEFDVLSTTEKQEWTAA